MSQRESKSCCQSSLRVGQKAPDFTVEGYFKGEIKKYSLSDYEGKWVVLFFYPLDFTFVCPTELMELNKKHSDFEKEDTVILGISVDSPYSHKAWAKEMGDFHYPLLSDLTKEVSWLYKVLLEEKGISLRGTFLISPEGKLRHYTVNDLDVGRNIDELLRLLHAFQTGELCPVSWKKGEKTLK